MKFCLEPWRSWMFKPRGNVQGGCQLLKGRYTVSTLANNYSVEGPGELHQLTTLPC